METYTGYTTRSEKTRNPERMSHGKVARKRYKSIDHRGPAEPLGQGWITGHQNKSPAPKNIACSTVCQVADRTPSVNSAGICQTTRVNAERVQHSAGLVTIRANRRRGDRQNTRRRERRTNGGIPIQKTRTGSPKRINAGATVISKRCLIMWTVSRLWSYAASGDPSAVETN